MAKPQWAAIFRALIQDTAREVADLLYGRRDHAITELEVHSAGGKKITLKDRTAPRTAGDRR